MGQLQVFDHDWNTEFRNGGMNRVLNMKASGTNVLLRMVLPLLVLNAALTFGNDWPGIGVVFEPRLSVEVLAGAVLLLVWTRWRGVVPSPALSTLAGFALLMVVLRYVEVTVPALLGRPLNLYWDGRHGWQVLRMATVDVPFVRLAGMGVALLVGGALLFALLRLQLAALGEGFRRSASVRVVLLALLAPFLLWALQPWVGRDTRAIFTEPVSIALYRAGMQLRDALDPGRRAAMLGLSPAFAGNVDALGGVDVILVFSEAYGAVTFDDAEIAAALKPSRQLLAQALGGSGRGVVSARVRSPTFGGASWLAHSSLLSGIDTSAPGSYDVLLTTARPTLVSHFAGHGYRTIALMPGLQRPWPEGAYYGFARYADADGIGYQGPAFGYWRIPDQASLALMHAQELAQPATERLPRFVVFPTVSSHAPFRPVAPYVNDWNAVSAAAAYSPAAHAKALAEPVSWSDPRPAYVQAMRYSFEWLSGYVRERAAPDSLIIVIGDHQPIAAVSGRGASWEVPVHVFSADAALLARFERAGFRVGLGEDAALLGSMPDLTRILLSVFNDSSDDRGDYSGGAPSPIQR